MIGPDEKLLQGGPVKLTPEHAAAQRAQARLSISHPKGSTEDLSSSFSAPQMPTRSASPLDHPSGQSREYPLVPVKIFLSSDTSARSTTQAPTPVNSDDEEKHELSQE
jgi:hypothetical protein